jgi:hypothetical protein
LLDQRADDEADPAAVGDVAPDSRAGSVLVDLRLEAGGAARGRIGVEEAAGGGACFRLSLVEAQRLQTAAA